MKHHLFEFLRHDLKLTCELVIQNYNICHNCVVLRNIILNVMLLINISQGLYVKNLSICINLQKNNYVMCMVSNTVELCD